MWLNTYFPFFQPTARQNKKWAEYENNVEFQNTFFNLFNLALNSFEFSGLPDTCNERFFKMALITSGMACIVKDPDLGFLSLSVSPAGATWNMYGECSRVRAYGWNGFNKEYENYMEGSDNSRAKAVVCRENAVCYPLLNCLLVYARRLSQTMRTIDVTAQKLKTPYFIVCDEAQKNSIEKILNDIAFNRDSIITNKSTTPDMFKILNTNVRAEALQALWNHYNNLNAEVRTLMGVKSAVNQDKAERLLVDEVNANDEMADLNLDYRLQSYQHFCDLVNEFWGLNITVNMNKEALDELSAIETNEGVDDPVS